MVRFANAAALCVILALSGHAAQAADEISVRLDGARAAYQKADLIKAAREAESAAKLLQARLGKLFGDAFPDMPAPWKADDIEVQSLSDIGGGLSVSRGFIHDDSSLNASLLLDAPAGDVLSAPVAGTPNTKIVKIGADDALVRFDPETKNGEISIGLDKRVVLEIQGDNIASEAVLLTAAGSWKIAKIRALLTD